MDDNPLYPYSAIVRRPPLRLPDNKRIAVYFGVNVEHYAWGRPALSLAPFTAQLVPDPLNHGWRDYGPRVGVFRLMDLFDRFDVPVTGIINSEASMRYPALVEEAEQRSWTWVAHGGDNSTWITGMAPAEERAYVAKVTQDIEQSTGRRPRGWLGPALTESAATNGILAELGYTYTLNWGIDDEPVALRVAGGRFLALPYATELNDIPAFVLHGQSGADFADAVIDQFDQLLEEGAARPRVMGIGLHPFLTGQPHRARQFARVLEHVRARTDDVWLTTSDGIAAAHLAR